MDLFSHRRSTQYFILCVAFVSHIYGETICPSSVKVEKGTNSSITCNTDEINPDFYWYKGEAEQKDLIGKLEGGISTVSEQYVGAYGIDLSASLGIRNAGLSHQSLYTLVTFNTNGTSEEDEVTLKITKDVTKCPEYRTIGKCTDSIITCTTDESTAALYWYKSSVEEKNLIGKVENGYFSISQQYSDKYDIDQTGSLQILNARLSHGSLYILLTFDSDGIQEEDKVILNNTRPCNLPKPTESPGESKSKSDVTPPISVAILVAVIVIAVALIGLVFIGCCFLVKKTRSYSTDTMQPTNSLSLQPMKEEKSQYTAVTSSHYNRETHITYTREVQ